MKKTALILLISFMLSGCSYLMADLFPKRCPHGIETQWGNICDKCQEVFNANNNVSK